MKRAILIVAILTFALPMAALAVTLNNSTFDTDTDGWSIELWTNKGVAAMAWDSASGNTGGGIKLTGNGSSDNEYANLREGGRLYKNFSSVGLQDMSVSFDVKYTKSGNAWASWETAPIGDVSTLYHGLLEDQLIVYAMTTVPVWTEVAWWSRSDNTGKANWMGLLPDNAWATKTIDLSGMTVANDNPVFNLMFVWQVNQSSDIGRLDNIVVSGDVIPEVPEPVGLVAFATFGIGMLGLRKRRVA